MDISANRIGCVVLEGGTDEIIEKKSRFIAQVFPVQTEQEAMQIIDQTKKKYWDARHNCYAFILGEHGEVSRCTDDGEPSGTAGRPILEVLHGAGVHDILVIVTRYFGGTLLGTGGLVRAYSQAAQAGLAASTIIDKLMGYRLEIRTDYNGIGKLQYIFGQMGLPLMDTIYAEDVVVTVAVPDIVTKIFDQQSDRSDCRGRHRSADKKNIFILACVTAR